MKETESSSEYEKRIISKLDKEIMYYQAQQLYEIDLLLRTNLIDNSHGD